MKKMNEENAVCQYIGIDFRIVLLLSLYFH